MEHDLSTCMELYKHQLAQGSIRRAYMLLIRYMGELKAKFPEPYATGNISLGYLDYTYFPFYNAFLRQRKLRFGLVLNHMELRFELWLMGQNALVQKTYWKLLKDTDWNKDIDAMPQYSVLAVCLENTIDFSHKDLMTEKIFNNAISLAERVQEFLMGCGA